MNVLVVDDDEHLREALRSALRAQGMTVTAVAGESGLWGALPRADVVLLDLVLPDADGFDLCRRLRGATDVPVILVTARSEVPDRMRGLYSGADDYVVKPFDVAELVARIHAVLRRTRVRPVPPGTTPPGGDIVVDGARRRAVVAGRHVPLTPKEFDVLALLVATDGAVCRRRSILLAVWGRAGDGPSRSLEVHLATLRAKLGRPGLVQTVRGVGYRFVRG